LAARLIAANIDPPDNRKRFEDTVNVLLSFESEGDSYDPVRARNALYRVMTQISGNKELDRVLSKIQVYLVRTQLRIALPNDRFGDYRDMTKANLSGDQAGAEEAGRRHIPRTAEALAEIPDRAFGLGDSPSPINSFKEDNEHA
jgi:DNA-binding GntR family transcriptional regulator